MMDVSVEQLNIFIVGCVTGLFLVQVWRIILLMARGKKSYFSTAQRDKLIDELQSKGFSVYRVFSGRADRMDQAQLDAAVRLLHEGYLVFSDRGMEALLLKVRPTKDELVKERRAQFRIVD